MKISEEVLRDEEGKLVLVSVGGPIDPEGRMLTAPDLAPELEVSWGDVGCPVEPRRYVGIRLKGAGGNQPPIVVKPGERKSITIQNREYVFAVDSAFFPGSWDGASCGSAKWTLYQKDFFVQDESVYP